LVEGKTAAPETCYTPSVLYKIRDEYNKHHSKKITEVRPNAVWRQLKTRLTNCDKEDCWLEEIKDSELRETLDTYVFAPDHPPSWNKNPNEWLSNIDILEVLKQYEIKHPSFKFIGPTPIDFDTRPKEDGGKCVWQELCTFDLGKYIEKGIYQFGIIFNLDPHNKGGSHWVSLFLCLDKVRPFAFFFDSAGSPIPKQIEAFVSRVQDQWTELYPRRPKIEFIQNAPHTHQYSNTECGMYSLIFIITMLAGKPVKRGGSEKERILSMEERIHLFQKGEITDKEAEMYRNRFFNKPSA
jgi:hypothetical protein